MSPFSPGMPALIVLDASLCSASKRSSRFEVVPPLQDVRWRRDPTLLPPPAAMPKPGSRMATNRFTAVRWRLDRIPALAWATGALAALALLLAFTTNGSAAVLMTLAVAAAYWTAREARRFIIAPSGDDQIELVGLAELAPLLEALPEPALLVDEHGRVVSSNSAARRQMQFEARGQFLTSILRHPDVLEAVQAAVRDGETRAVEYETTTQVDRHTRCYVAPVTWGADRAAMRPSAVRMVRSGALITRLRT